MRYEYKIKMEADLYGVPLVQEKNPLAETAARLTAGEIKGELDEVLDHYNMSHKFCNIHINVIPHDNNRIYTEADAEKHLNGEPPKKRKTYADDYFEKFPNAPKMDVLTASWGIAHVPYPKFEDVYGGIKAIEVGKTKNVCFPNSKRDHFALWMAEMDDGE